MRVFVCALLIVGNALAEEVWTPFSCTTKRCWGRRIENDTGILRFCVSRFQKVKRETGSHGDLHYSIPITTAAGTHTLHIASGFWFTGKDPREGDTRWTVRQWKCGDNLKGEDYRLAEVSVRSRYITLNAMLGYARYDRVPVEAAVCFDKILDSLCWSE